MHAKPPSHGFFAACTRVPLLCAPSLQTLGELPSLGRRVSLLVGLAILGVLLAPTCAWGHGDPVQIRRTEGRLFLETVAVSGEFSQQQNRLLTDLPNFGIAFPSNGVQDDEVLSLKIIDNLWYWDPNQRRLGPSSRTLGIQGQANTTVLVDQHGPGENRDQVVLGTYNRALGWHADLLYYMNDLSAAEGAYATQAVIVSNLSGPTSPFVLMLNRFGENYPEELADSSLREVSSRLNRRFPGDANLDGKVDINDFIRLRARFGTVGAWADGDFDRSGKIDIADFIVLRNSFGSGLGASAVPEPTAAGLFVLSMLALLAIRYPFYARR